RKPFAVGAERYSLHAALVPSQGEDQPREDLLFPVEPLEPSAIDAALVGWKLLDESVSGKYLVAALPVPLEEIHSVVVSVSLGQCGLLRFLGLGRTGVLQTLSGQLDL